MEQTFTIPYKTLDRSELSEQDRQLEERALEVARKAYAPYSRFHVGAAVLLANGEIVTGSNQENAAYPSGTCAERTALFWAGAQWPDVAVERLSIVDNNSAGRVPAISPSGICRQASMDTATSFNTFPIRLLGEEKTILK